MTSIIVRTGGEIADLTELTGVVEEILEGDVGVERTEMFLHHLERFVNTLFDGDGRHNDDELVEAVTLVQLEHRAQINVGLARAGLHLNGEVTGSQRNGWR